MEEKVLCGHHVENNKVNDYKSFCFFRASIQRKQIASNVTDEFPKWLIENILQGTISTSRSLMENANGRELEGGNFACVKMYLLVQWSDMPA